MNRDIEYRLKRCCFQKSPESTIGRGGVNTTTTTTTTTTIDDLTEALLVEILVRLPVKVANQCKSVSKRWCESISDPWFIHKFVRHQIETSPPVVELPFTLVPQKPSLRYKEEFNATYSSSDLSSLLKGGLSLDFLPPYTYEEESYDFSWKKRKMNEEELKLAEPEPLMEGEEDEPYPPYHVLGASNDLVLCGRTCGPPFVYYVCNPFTKHWFELPPTPLSYNNDVELFRVLSGFVCDPCYHNLTSLAAMDTILVPPRYRVFSVPYYLSEEEPSWLFPVQIFSSETGQWRELKLLFPSPVNLHSTQAHVSNAKLHWLSGSDRIFAYDPFSNHELCSVIDLPPELKGTQNIHLGVCRGHLRVLNMVCAPMDYGPFVEGTPLPMLNVWELEDYGHRRWRKVHDDVTMELRGTILTTILSEFWCGYELDMTIAFHPYDGDIVYFWLFQNFFIFNISSGMLQVITKDNPRDLFPAAVGMVFSLVQPWFPTPVLSPQLP